MKNQKKTEFKEYSFWKSPVIRTLTSEEVKKTVKVAACSEYYGECYHGFWR